jgi:Tfp pilus assembly protein PilN
MSRYSFIKPGKKGWLDQESTILALFLVVTMALVLGFGLFLTAKRNAMLDEIHQMRAQSAILKQESAKYNAQIARIKKLAAKYEAITTNNTLLKESIQNLFDLVPDQITLTKALLNRDGLILYGVTPSKDIYNYLLLAPLRSVFENSSTTFYPLKNGWWRFVSVNEGNIDNGSGAEE